MPLAFQASAETGEDEVEVAHVVARHDGATGARDVLPALHVELEPEGLERAQRGDDDGGVDGLDHVGTLRRRPPSCHHLPEH